jgi:hypothetical protein
MDGPISFLAERVADGIKEGRPNALHSIHLCQNNLGPATYPSLSHLLDVSTSLTSLNITNAFDPLTDDDGVLLMKVIGANIFRVWGLGFGRDLRHTQNGRFSAMDVLGSRICVIIVAYSEWALWRNGVCLGFTVWVFLCLAWLMTEIFAILGAGCKP